MFQCFNEMTHSQRFQDKTTLKWLNLFNFKIARNVFFEHKMKKIRKNCFSKTQTRAIQTHSKQQEKQKLEERSAAARFQHKNS